MEKDLGQNLLKRFISPSQFRITLTSTLLQASPIPNYQIKVQSEKLDEEDKTDDNDAFIKPGIEKIRNVIKILERFSAFARFGGPVIKAL